MHWSCPAKALSHAGIALHWLCLLPFSLLLALAVSKSGISEVNHQRGLVLLW
jgi:hypothetical protein